MIILFGRILGKCVRKGLWWGCIQLYLTGLIFLFWTPVNIVLIICLIPTVLFAVPFFGCIHGLIVSLIYYLFYNRTGRKTRLMAVTTSVVICSSIFLIYLSICGIIGYNYYIQEWVFRFFWHLVYLVLNTAGLSWRLGKFAEQVIIESNKLSEKIPVFQKVTLNPILHRIKRDYLSVSRYQLDTKLLALGYSPAAVETAWQIFLFNTPQPPKPSTQFSRTYILLNFLVLSAVLFWVFFTARLR